MTKIRVELEVPKKYCDRYDNFCPMLFIGNYGVCCCAAFGNCELEEDRKNGYSIRCEQCKQAEVKE